MIDIYTDFFGTVKAKKIGETNSESLYSDEKGNLYIMSKVSSELIGKPKPICIRQDMVGVIKKQNKEWTKEAS